MYSTTTQICFVNREMEIRENEIRVVRIMREGKRKSEKVMKVHPLNYCPSSIFLHECVGIYLNIYLFMC